MSTEERYKNLKRLYEASGNLDYALVVFGDHLAKREGYKELDGIDAIQFYLATKYRWLPSSVRAMSFEDMRFLLTEEMSGWTLPKASI